MTGQTQAQFCLLLAKGAWAAWWHSKPHSSRRVAGSGTWCPGHMETLVLLFIVGHQPEAQAVGELGGDLQK
jgi:hypothetical protein